MPKFGLVLAETDFDLRTLRVRGQCDGQGHLSAAHGQAGDARQFRHGKLRKRRGICAFGKSFQGLSNGLRARLAQRRQAIALLRNKEVTYRLFNEIAPAFRDVNGGYTRTLKLGPRQGDAAEMVLLELTREPVAAA